MGERTVKKCENVDRGLAYALMASSFMLRVLLNGMAWSTSYNVIFVCEFVESKSVMTWTISLTAAMMYGIGLVPSILINTYGCRLDIIIGCIISFLGLFSIYISPNLYVLFFTLGIVTGAMFDIRGDYSMAFYIGGLFCLLSSLAMIYPILESRSSSTTNDVEINPQNVET